MKIIPTFTVPDLPGTKALSPAGPPTFLGGTLSGHPCIKKCSRKWFPRFEKKCLCQSGLKDRSSNSNNSSDKTKTKNGPRNTIKPPKKEAQCH